MKKTILTLSFLICTSITLLHAQAFQKGDNVISAGIGIGSSLSSIGGASQMPGFSVNYEKGLWEAGEDGVISLGGYLGMKTYRYKNTSLGDRYTYKWNYTIAGLRGAYHYTGLSNENIDLYGGLMLSLNFLKYKDAYTSSSSSSAAGFTAYVGGRYYFNENLAANAEIGYGISFLSLGVSYKF